MSVIYQSYIGNHGYIGNRSKISALNEKISLKFQRYIRYIRDIYEKLVKN